MIKLSSSIGFHSIYAVLMQCLQGPFCLMQMVYWLEKGYLKGTDFVYTDNPRFSVSLNQVLAGAKPLENLV